MMSPELLRRKGQKQIRPHENGDRPNLNHYASSLLYPELFPVLFPEKTKKACILLHFCIIILFKEKAISYHPLVITTAARSRLIVIGSNGTKGFYADPYNDDMITSAKRHKWQCMK